MGYVVPACARATVRGYAVYDSSIANGKDKYIKVKLWRKKSKEEYTSQNGRSTSRL